VEVESDIDINKKSIFPFRGKGNKWSEISERGRMHNVTVFLPSYKIQE
jgi:hypothetical protein